MALLEPSGPRLCVNAEEDACNWIAPEDHAFCLACRHNGVIPPLAGDLHLRGWRAVEAAKHRLFYSLLRLGLPLTTRSDDPERGLRFEFLADEPGGGPKVMTGHDEGLITLALAEADDAERERRRTTMGEPYRTLLGHFRHEIGHYFWNVLVRDGARLEECRAVFGDDGLDYGEALNRHHAEGAPPDWRLNHVSAYATMHPWEDFAETFAHYLHIVDTLETGAAFGVEIAPRADAEGHFRSRVDFDPYRADEIETVVAAWLPFAVAMNAINRSMGQSDLYPFVLSPAVIGKLGFIHKLIHRR
jgi:hypothetical protein